MAIRQSMNLYTSHCLLGCDITALEHRRPWHFLEHSSPWKPQISHT